jgi:hypothetical protein
MVRHRRNGFGGIRSGPKARAGFDSQYPQNNPHVFASPTGLPCPAGHHLFRKRHSLTPSQLGLIRTTCCNFSNASIAAYQSDGLEETAALDLTEGYKFAKWRKPVQTLRQRLPLIIERMTFVFLVLTLIPQPMTGSAWTNLYRLLSASYSANAQLPYRILQMYERAISYNFV